MRKISLLLIGILLLGMQPAAAQENLYQMTDISSSANGQTYSDNESPRYNFVDISKNANSKVYIDSSPTPGQPVPWDDFIKGPLDGVSYRGNAKDRVGIQTSSIQSMTSDGILTDGDGVEYELTFSDVITVVAGSSTSNVDVENRIYRSMNFLATVVCNVQMDIGVDVVYTDGSSEAQTVSVQNCYNSTGANVVATPSMYSAWGGSRFTRGLTLAIRCYQIPVDSSKAVDRIVFQNESAVDVKILAITGTEGTDAQIKAGISAAIADLKNDGDYLLSIQNNLDLLSERGVPTEDIPGLDSFYEAFGKCVYVQGVEQQTDFDTVDFCFHFLNPVGDGSGLVTVSKNGETVADAAAEVSEREMHVRFPNTMEYDAVYTITLSADLYSAEDRDFTLGTEKVYSMTVTAPLLYENTTAVISGGTLNFKTDLRSNLTDTASVKLFVAVYTQEGEMLDGQSIDCSVSGGDSFAVSASLNTDSQTGLVLECYMLDDYSNLRYLYPDMKLEL